MKKGIIIILIFSMIFLFCVGCTHTYSNNRLKEGTYLSEEDYETDDFSKGRFLIKRINKETFDSTNGINGLKVNYSDSPSSFYYSFEMYLFSNISNQEELVQIKNFKYNRSNGAYSGEAYLKVIDKEFSGEIKIWYYNTVLVSLFDFSCNYQLEISK